MGNIFKQAKDPEPDFEPVEAELLDDFQVPMIMSNLNYLEPEYDKNKLSVEPSRQEIAWLFQ